MVPADDPVRGGLTIVGLAVITVGGVLVERGARGLIVTAGLPAALVGMVISPAVIESEEVIRQAVPAKMGSSDTSAGCCWPSGPPMCWRMCGEMIAGPDGSDHAGGGPRSGAPHDALPVLVLARWCWGTCRSTWWNWPGKGPWPASPFAALLLMVSEVVPDIGIGDVSSLSTLAGTLTRPAPSKGNKTAAAD